MISSTQLAKFTDWKWILLLSFSQAVDLLGFIWLKIINFQSPADSHCLYFYTYDQSVNMWHRVYALNCFSCVMSETRWMKKFKYFKIMCKHGLLNYIIKQKCTLINTALVSLDEFQTYVRDKFLRLFLSSCLLPDYTNIVNFQFVLTPYDVYASLILIIHVVFVWWCTILTPGGWLFPALVTFTLLI